MLKQYIRDIYIYIYLIYHKYWTCVALSKCAFLLSAHTAIDVILWFLLHPSKDFLLKSSNGSFVDIKLHFKSLTSEIQFHHEGCCTLLPTSKHHCKPFKDSEQSQCGELTSQYTLYFSHQVLLDFNQGQQLLSVNINFKWIINLCWIFFFVCVSETTPKDNLLTAEYISFHMHFVSHCFLFASAFIFSSYDALFPPRGFVGMLAYICVFLSVANCAAYKSLASIKDYFWIKEHFWIFFLSSKLYPHWQTQLSHANHINKYQPKSNFLLSLLWLEETQLLLLQHSWINQS